MKRRTIIAANWKMNGSYQLLEDMANGLNQLDVAETTDIVLNVPAPFLAKAKSSFTHDAIAIGAQNMSEHASGAYTGEISAQMLNELGVKYVVLGHSERRSMYKESSSIVAKKVSAALEAGLIPILCIGESEEERESGETETVLASQLQPVIDEVGIEKFADLVVAYEPVWAIGTGKTASPEMAQETHSFVRKFLADIDATVAAKVPLLYGGSMNAENCKSLITQQDIDGGLIGGASLKVPDFSTICLSA